MQTYSLRYEQIIPISVNDAWEFFSSPLNLARITPPEMNFKVTSPYTADTKIYAGMIITYKVSPLWGIPLNWISEITHVKEKEYFVDEQLNGPYALWHHEHHFKPVDEGVHMTDMLTYALPYGFLGRMAYRLVVRQQLLAIFEYRKQAIIRIFGTGRA